MTKQELELKVEELQKIIIEKDKQIEMLEKSAATPKHNERNAGRKKADEKWVASFSRFMDLYESQKTINEIMEEMEISRATYYRYKKLYEDTNVSIKK